ncbi:MAG: 50S ribosomal protein L16 [Bdellovibrionales bacterium]|nr:50S ribosomal protein L16 [Bdellovibrionales bacterium]
MQQPKKFKYRKTMKQVDKIRGTASRGAELSFGEVALQAKQGGWISARQIEAGRVAATRHMKRGGKLFIRVFADKPVTSKPAETRMGKGKGSPEKWVASVQSGRVIYEITGVPTKTARRALELAASKMPVTCNIIERKRTIL